MPCPRAQSTSPTGTVGSLLRSGEESRTSIDRTRSPPALSPWEKGRTDLRSCKMHPGEKFYPEGVRWDDPIARGTLPDLLSAAASEFGARPAIEFRDRPISYTELEALVETAASAFLRAGYGKDTFGRAVPRQFARSSRQFLRRAEGRRPHRASVARSTARSRCRTSSRTPARACSSPAICRRCCRPR